MFEKYWEEDLSIGSVKEDVPVLAKEFLDGKVRGFTNKQLCLMLRGLLKAITDPVLVTDVVLLGLRLATTGKEVVYYQDGQEVDTVDTAHPFSANAGGAWINVIEGEVTTSPRAKCWDKNQ